MTTREETLSDKWLEEAIYARLVWLDASDPRHTEVMQFGRACAAAALARVQPGKYLAQICYHEGCQWREQLAQVMRLQTERDEARAELEELRVTIQALAAAPEPDAPKWMLDYEAE